MRKIGALLLCIVLLSTVFVSAQDTTTCNIENESTVTQDALDAYNLSDWETALVAYDCLVQLNPDDARIINTRGFLHYQLETPDLAVADFEQAIDINPSLALPYANLGFVYLNFDEDIPAALEAFTNAVERDLDLVNGYFGRAQAYGQAELYAQSRADLLTAIELTESEDAFLLTQLADVELVMEDIELEATIDSVQGGFSVNYPPELLQANSQPSTPENVTMASDFSVFTPEGIALDPGDVVVVVDFGDSQSVGAIANATAQEVAEHIASLATGEISPVTRITAGTRSGFTFTSRVASERFLRQMIFEVDGGLILSITSLHTREESSAAFIPFMLAMVESVFINTDLIDGGASQTQTGVLSGVLSATYINPDDGFTLLHPQGWLVETGLVGTSEFVIVTPGEPFDLENPPIAGNPNAIIAYGTVTELTGLTANELDRDTDVFRVVEAIIGVDSSQVQVVDLDGRSTGLVFTQDPNFDNLFVTIILDDNFFVAANMFTAPGEDSEFFDIIINMLQQVTFTN